MCGLQILSSHETREGWGTRLRGSGRLYLAVVSDIFSRKVAGWSMAGRLYTELVVDVLDMAIKNRLPTEGLIRHSDHGSQYTSLTFGKHLEQEKHYSALWEQLGTLSMPHNAHGAGFTSHPEPTAPEAMQRGF